MPEMDGYEAARRIREAEGARRKEDGAEIHTPIIAFTAGVMENKDLSPLAGVFDDWVYKPFREEEIFAKLERHLGVQFVYQPSVRSAVEQDQTREKAALTPADLSVLPVDWLKEFFETLQKGRSTQLQNMIKQVPPEHAEMARALAELVRVHQFDRLIPLVREALKENADG
jgi:CheY-like chemotaxis protein